MNLGLATARSLVSTSLDDVGLQVLIDAVNSDMRRLGGDAYPMRFSRKLLDTKVVSADGADAALTRSLVGADAPVGSSKITTTETALEEVSYVLAAIDSGAVTINVDGITIETTTPGATIQRLSGLADDELYELSFYIVSSKRRAELLFVDAEDADAAMPDRVTWEIPSARRDAVRAVLTGVQEGEYIRFVIAEPHAGLIMSLDEWNDNLDRIAVSCLRISATDKAVARYVSRGADVQETVDFLNYSDEYQKRLRQVLALTGNFFA